MDYSWLRSESARNRIETPGCGLWARACFAGCAHSIKLLHEASTQRHSARWESALAGSPRGLVLDSVSSSSRTSFKTPQLSMPTVRQIDSWVSHSRMRVADEEYRPLAAPPAGPEGRRKWIYSVITCAKRVGERIDSVCCSATRPGEIKFPDTDVMQLGVLSISIVAT